MMRFTQKKKIKPEYAARGAISLAPAADFIYQKHVLTREKTGRTKKIRIASEYYSKDISQILYSQVHRKAVNFIQGTPNWNETWQGKPISNKAAARRPGKVTT